MATVPLHLVSESDVNEFLSAKPTRDDIEKLEKSELLLISRKLGIRVESDNVFPLRNAICSRLFGTDEYSFAEKLGEFRTDPVSGWESRESVYDETVIPNPGCVNDEQAKRDHEFRMLQLQTQQEQLRAQQEQARINLERYKIDKGVHVPAAPVVQSRPDKKLVPVFEDHKVVEFFDRFEKIATGNKWPKDQWSTLAQTAFTGKALRAFDSLSFEDSQDYEVLKKAVLRSYELRPEAYRQRFRNCRKRPSETHVDFGSVLTGQFDAWMRSEKIAGSYERLKELVILENFMGKMEPDLQLFLTDKRVKTVSEAAVYADDYYLIRSQFKSKGNTTHKSTPSPNLGTSQPTKAASNSNNTSSVSQNNITQRNTHTPTSPKSQRKPFSCTNCGKLGHTVDRCWRKAGVARPSMHVGHSQVPTVTLSSESHDNCKGSSVGNFSAPRVVNAPGGSVSGKGTAGQPTVTGGVVQAVASAVTTPACYTPYLLAGEVRLHGVKYPARILRDTGASISLWVRPNQVVVEEGEFVLIKGVTGSLSVPLVECDVECELFAGHARVGVVECLPEKGIDLILGNDLVGGEVVSAPVLTKNPVFICDDFCDNVIGSDVFPACAVTRSMSRKGERQREEDPVVVDVSTPVPPADDPTGGSVPPDNDITLCDTFMSDLDSNIADENDSGDVGNIDVNKFRDLQAHDIEIQKLRSLAVESLDEEKGTCYFLKDDVLWRRWRPPHIKVGDGMWDYFQIVVPKACRQELIKLAHSSPFAGHLGVRKTHERLRAEFYWSTMKADVAHFVKCCHTCQVVGQPNQPPPKSPLIPIPVTQPPFSRLIIDIVGPLPPTSTGSQYLLTIMDPVTRYPEAFPLRSATAKNVTNALLGFFTRFGLPQEIQSDRGSNFCANLFQQVLAELGVRHVKSSAYHPETQGALERYHQTLKNMLRKYCMEHCKDWDKGLPFVLFATRETPQESLGFSPNELVFGHRVRGPLSLVKEAWSSDSTTSRSLLQYVIDFKTRIHETLELARENLKSAQARMKERYDDKTQQREFQVGDEVLVLLPLQGKPLAAKYCGPYVVERRVGEVDYVVKTPDRRKSHQLCHANMLKRYHRPPGTVATVQHVTTAVAEEEGDAGGEDGVSCEFQDCHWLEDGEAESILQSKLQHLSSDQAAQLTSLLSSHREVFANAPGRTDWACHDVDVGDSTPVKLPPYRVSPRHIGLLRQEIEYMLEHDLISPCTSEWSSPVTLQPKSDGTARFCIDYRKVNAVTKTDTYPLPRLEDCVDRVGAARYITKIDLKKGFWQVPLTKRAREISCFVADGQTYRCNVMPFGMKNAPATFQRLMNSVIKGLNNCVVYLDDVVIHTDTWDQHLSELEKFLSRLSQAHLVVNLEKCEFVHARVQYLGYLVGHGVVSPPDSKVEALKDFPRPSNRRELRRFLGCIGYYRRFLKNFATVVAPLTELLRKDNKFVWDNSCEESFSNAKDILINYPVMIAPDFDKTFSLAADASNVGAGAVLMQEDDQGVEHPVCYYSKKFSSAQKNYSVIEKELLALILALQHFSVYVPAFGPIVKVYTDHHPLKYLNSLGTKNQRLTRWSLFLQQYNLEIKHIKGVDNVIADCLSRK